MSELSQIGFDQPAFWLSVLEIIGVNILLSGDNAVVIALACRNLPPRTRNWGIAIGSAIAVILLVVFTGIVATILGWPWLKFVGGIALLYIAIDLVKSEEEDVDKEITASDKLWRAVATVVVADIVMSLDNVVAIAAVAKGSWVLLILGLTVSIPLIVVGAAMITGLFERWPILIWVGAALLGWVAGGLMANDPIIDAHIGAGISEAWEPFAAALGAIFVVGVGYLRWTMKRHEAKPKPKSVAKKQNAGPGTASKKRAAEPAKRRKEK